MVLTLPFYMRKILLLAVLATGAATASAQSGKPAGTTSKSNGDNSYGPASSATIAPNGPVDSGVRPGQKVNTAPATGANRASRSSSTAKASRQGSATASDNPQSMRKNSAVKPGAKH